LTSATPAAANEERKRHIVLQLHCSRSHNFAGGVPWFHPLVASESGVEVVEVSGLISSMRKKACVGGETVISLRQVM
jgi:hypothetical protein